MKVLDLIDKYYPQDNELKHMDRRKTSGTESGYCLSGRSRHAA